MAQLRSWYTVYILASISTKDEEKACTALNDKGERIDELDDEDDKNDDGQSSSNVSKPADSADEDAAYDRYLIESKKKAEEFKREHEAVVQEAYSHFQGELKKGKSIPIGLIEGGWWNLYSAEYLTHYFVEKHLGKRLRFGKLYDNIGDIPQLVCGPGQVSAELHIYPEGHLDICPFDLPLHATLEPVIVKCWQNHDI